MTGCDEVCAMFGRGEVGGGGGSGVGWHYQAEKELSRRSSAQFLWIYSSPWEAAS